MRMRRKKNIPEKLSQLTNLLQADALRNPPALFEFQQPLMLEIGMGKGGFLHAMAKRHPQWNFLGLDRSDMIVLKAGRLLESQRNVRVLIANMEDLEEIFPDACIDGIFLNFSDPWPKDRHYKRRLTYRDYLRIYHRILKPGGTIQFKSDNEALYRFSLQELQQFPGTLHDMTEDLHQSPAWQDNIMTEYEKKFAEEGMKIFGFRYRMEL